MKTILLAALMLAFVWAALVQSIEKSKELQEEALQIQSELEMAQVHPEEQKK